MNTVKHYCQNCGSKLGINCGDAESDFNEDFCSAGCWQVYEQPERTMAKFHKLDPQKDYDILCPDSGQWLTQGISGCDAQVNDADWPEGAEAYLANGDEDADPIEIAT
jgi:hypothetical protein